LERKLGFEFFFLEIVQERKNLPKFQYRNKKDIKPCIELNQACANKKTSPCISLLFSER